MKNMAHIQGLYNNCKKYRTGGMDGDGDLKTGVRIAHSNHKS